MGSTAVKLGQNWLNMMELFIIVLVTLCIWVHGDFFLFLEISFSLYTPSSSSGLLL